MAFEEHVRNSRKQVELRTGRPQRVPEVGTSGPVYFKCNRFNVIGHDADVIWPSYSDWMDYELELACVIGRTGKDISSANAAAHVFGFTIFNDVSARDVQFDEMKAGLGPAKGKDFDTGNVFGPWIVTLDEIGDPHALAMEARVNGERWGGGNSRAMHHTFLGHHRLCLAGRNAVCRRDHRLRHGRHGLGPRTRAHSSRRTT